MLEEPLGNELLETFANGRLGNALFASHAFLAKPVAGTAAPFENLGPKPIGNPLPKLSVAFGAASTLHDVLYIMYS